MFLKRGLFIFRIEINQCCLTKCWFAFQLNVNTTYNNECSRKQIYWYLWQCRVKQICLRFLSSNTFGSPIKLVLGFELLCLGTITPLISCRFWMTNTFKLSHILTILSRFPSFMAIRKELLYINCDNIELQYSWCRYGRFQYNANIKILLILIFQYCSICWDNIAQRFIQY